MPTSIPRQYACEVLDKNHDEFVSLSEIVATENTPYWTAGLIPSMMLVDNTVLAAIDLLKD
jgi:hypothetical protein